MTMSTSLFGAPRYTRVAIGLHWLLALAIIGNLCVGLYMTDLAMSPQRLKLYNWHKWAGVMILTFSALRLLWRITHRPPALPHSLAHWQARASHGVHIFLYVLFFAVPLSGWAYSSATGFPIVLFGVLPLPDFVAKNRELAEAIKPLHQWLAYGLAGTVTLHITAALKHQWIDRDQLLSRMWPHSKK
jgi:cytochrome b561